MSSFKPAGYQSFVKKSSTFKVTPRDTLLEVISYDLPSYTINAKTVATEAQPSKIVKLKVSKEAVDRCRPGEKKHTSAKWFGHLIDSRMEDNISVGDKFVAEKSVWVAKDGDTGIYECTRIISLPDQGEDKIIQGLITLNPNKEGDHVRSFQVWENKSYSLSGKSLKHVGDLLNEVIAKRDAGGKPHTVGFQFRAIKNGEVVEQTACYDYIPAVREGDVVVTPARLFSSKDLISISAEFEEHVIESGTIPELAIYRNYIGSSFSGDLDIKQPFEYINKKGEKKMMYYANYRMSTCKTKLTQVDEDFITSKNLCVNGIIAFTSDEYDKRTKTANTRNIVQKAFLEGSSGNIHAWIRSPDGSKVTFSDSLRIFDNPVKTVEPTTFASKELPVTDDDFDESMFAGTETFESIASSKSMKIIDDISEKDPFAD